MSAEGSPSTGHSRNISRARRQALPRRSTQDPLAGNDPLTLQTQSPAPSSSRPSAAQSRDISRVRNESPRSSSPIGRPASELSSRPLKDFGFLLRPVNFQPLNRLDAPESFRDSARVGEGDTVQSLLDTGRFMAAAVLAADMLKSHPDRTNYQEILSLFYIRLACLQLLGLTFVAATESKALQDLHGPFYRDQETGEHLAPWELRVLAVRLQAIGFEDRRRCIMGFYDLARDARHHIQHSSGEERTLWMERLEEIGVRVADALVEMSDAEGAIRHLKSLQQSQTSGARNQAFMGLVYLQLGDSTSAAQCFGSIDDPSHEKFYTALVHIADGEYKEAIEALKKEGEGNEMPVVATQDLAVAELYHGNIDAAKRLLEETVTNGIFTHGITFNLATVYELESDKATEKKTALAVQAAGQPQSASGWHKTNDSFKL